MSEKLIINTNLLRKESEFRTKSCVVEKAIAVTVNTKEEIKDMTADTEELMSIGGLSL